MELAWPGPFLRTNLEEVRGEAFMSCRMWRPINPLLLGARCEAEAIGTT